MKQIEKYCIECVYYTDERGKHIRGCFLFPYKRICEGNIARERFLEFERGKWKSV